MDSREYVFLFPVNTLGDVPADFRTSVQGRSFEAGIFLPQDGTKWFTRPPNYPARLLLLNERCLSIVPHPTTQQPMVELNLDDLIQLETGNSLLRGWVQLRTRFASYHLLYNTRASRSLDRFIRAVRRRWLEDSLKRAQPEQRRPKIFGHQLDIKFRNMLDDALDRDETVLSQYFAAPLEDRHKVLIFRRIISRPGHLIALTSGNRLLWLNDEYGGYGARYTGTSISVPLSLFQSARLQSGPDQENFTVNFIDDFSWRISLHGSNSSCSEFVQTLNGYSDPEMPKHENLAAIQ